MNLQTSRNTQFGGHRGLPKQYPDNSLAGIVAAAQVADFVEIDVRRSADGVFVLSHEPEIGGIPICSSNWSELRRVDIGDGHPPTTLNEVISELPETPLDIEVKNWPVEEGFDPTGSLGIDVARLARPFDVVTSFFWPTVDSVKAALPDATTGLLTFEEGTLGDAIEWADRAGHDLVAPKYTLALADPDLIEDAKRRGLDVIVWTVNSPADARLLQEMGVDAIISDDPVSIRETK